MRLLSPSPAPARAPARAQLLGHVLASILALVLALMPGLAAGQSLDDLVPRLALGDFADRAEVVAQIGRTGDSRAAAVLDALLARTLEVRASDGRVVRVTDARRAVDPLSGEDLGPAGGRATTAIRVNNGLRRDIRTALGVLTLADPDPARPRAAAEAALREAFEEVALDPSSDLVLGETEVEVAGS